MFSKKLLALLPSLMNMCLEITKSLTLLVTSKSFRNPSHLSSYVQLGYLNFFKGMLDDWLGLSVVGIKKKTQKLEFTNRMNPLSSWSLLYICAILSNFSILVQHLSVNISSIFRLIYLPCPHSAYIFIVLFSFIFFKVLWQLRAKALSWWCSCLCFQNVGITGLRHLIQVTSFLLVILFTLPANTKHTLCYSGGLRANFQTCILQTQQVSWCLIRFLYANWRVWNYRRLKFFYLHLLG